MPVDRRLVIDRQPATDRSIANARSRLQVTLPSPTSTSAWQVLSTSSSVVMPFSALRIPSSSKVRIPLPRALRRISWVGCLGEGQLADDAVIVIISKMPCRPR